MKKIILFVMTIFAVIAINYAVTGRHIDTTGMQISQIRGTSLSAQWESIDDILEVLLKGGTIGTRCTFDSVGIASTKTTGGGIATGAGGDENLLLFPEAMFEYHILGTQSILQPAWVAASGLNIAMDQSDNDGLELTQGITASAKHAFVIGTDAAFYFKVTLDIADITGTDDLAIGFRLAEAYQDGPDAYNDWAAFNIIQGVIYLETEVNAGGTTTTDTTEVDWGDGEEHTFQINVSAVGAVTYLYDATEPNVVAAFTFDDGDVVLPFLLMLQHGDLTEVVDLVLWEVGYQSEL